MLLACDVGNSHTVIGCFDGARLLEHWRLATSADRTADESAVLIDQLLRLGAVVGVPTAAIIASVVPGATEALRVALRRRFSVEALLVGPELDTGMPVLYDNPAEVGADRIVNAVAAYARWRQGLIVVDFGTATTFDCVTPRGEYLGGAIAPGLAIGAEALYRRTAKLPRVAIERPARALGRSTVASMQAGLYFGYAGLVDGIVNALRAELDFKPKVVATGGLAGLIAGASAQISEVDELLTLEGLRLLAQRHHDRAPA